MFKRINVMVQVKDLPQMAAASYGPFKSAPDLDLKNSWRGFNIDNTFSPVPLLSGVTKERGFHFGPADAEKVQSSYILRATLDVDMEDISVIDRIVESDDSIIGIFSDPLISTCATCPGNRVFGTDKDVEHLLDVAWLQGKGMDGSGVNVVIVDTGVNMTHLKNKGKTPRFDPSISWGPHASQPLGNMPVGHGTMCAYDVCIAAPQCTLADHALLTSNTPGGSSIDGLLSDAVASYGALLSLMMRGSGDRQQLKTLVVNNSWGMYHPSWDFPVGHNGNFSDNPNHPFNIIVTSLEAAGADIVFAAGNCGADCPDRRCQNVTRAIYGANSSPSVLSVAGVLTNKDRVGYSSQGPGRLEKQKPDIACYTHFKGSGVWSSDSGTSASAPVAAGVIAAIRTMYPADLLPPADLRKLIKDTAEKTMGPGYNHDIGHGIMDVPKLVREVEKEVAARYPV